MIPESWPVWFLGAAGTLGGIITAFPGVLGRYRKMWEKITANRRRTAIEIEDADIAEKDRQIRNLAMSNEALELREAKTRQVLADRDRLVWEHIPWDQAQIERGAPTFPPRLFLPHSASSAPERDED